ncbi:MAG: hypothetical protein A2Z20_00960 [Bdellovibrionales bacterium RBG_16_40_8]|nr:MAG: hypothetical protein A2Z20_00960 [Bdellovibrionales bacterium RBG_16_40_8]
MTVPTHAGWSVDFSRRQEQMNKERPLDADLSVVTKKTEEKGVFERVFDSVVPTQDLVIINTEQGFIPATLRVKEGAQYRIVVVNVNEKARNVSFVLDAFSEHHATFYGKIKSFFISPKKEGVYTFMSPETSAQGRIIVYPSAGSPQLLNIDARAPASE